MSTRAAVKDAAFFKKTASVSEEKVLTALAVTAQEHDRPAITAFVEHLEKHGFSKKESASRLLNNARVSVKVNKTIHEVRLTRALLESLMLGAGRLWDDAQRNDALALIDRVGAVVKKEGGEAASKNFYSHVLFDAASVCHDKVFAQDLMKRGANPDTVDQSWAFDRAGPRNVFTEAVLHINAAVASVLVPSIDAEKAENVINDFVQPLKPYSPSLSALGSLALAVRIRPHDVFELMSAFDQHFSVERTAPLRARVLSFYLAESHANHASWEESVVQELLGKPESATLQALASQALVDAQDNGLREKKSNGKGTPLWQELLEHALKTHCHEVVGLFGERLKVKAAQDPSAMLRLTLEKTGHPSLYFSHRFKPTLQVLQTNGHRFDNAMLEHPPAVHMIAEARDEPEVRAAKLAVLLDLGVDPHQKDARGHSTSIYLLGEGLEQWQKVVRAHEARQAANNVLSEIENLEWTEAASKSRKP